MIVEKALLYRILFSNHQTLMKTGVVVVVVVVVVLFSSRRVEVCTAPIIP